jgi:hemoglobin
MSKFGHSDVREMHRHVEIGTAEKDAWLLCMSKAIDRIGIAPDIAATLMKHFRAVANALENQNSTMTRIR